MTSVNGSRSAAITGGSTALSDRDHGGDHERAAWVVDADPRHEPGGDVDRERGNHPSDDQAERAELRPRRVPGDLGSVRGLAHRPHRTAAARWRLI